VKATFQLAIIKLAHQDYEACSGAPDKAFSSKIAAYADQCPATALASGVRVAFGSTPPLTNPIPPQALQAFTDNCCNKIGRRFKPVHHAWLGPARVK